MAVIRWVDLADIAVDPVSEAARSWPLALGAIVVVAAIVTLAALGRRSGQSSSKSR